MMDDVDNISFYPEVRSELKQQRLNGKLKISVSDVSSISRFYFHVIDEVHTKNWDKIIKMRIAYEKMNENSGIEKLKKEDFFSEMWICVRCPAWNSWDRAKVLSSNITEKGTIKVFFVDYGTVAYVEVQHCFRLLDDFHDIVPHVFRGALSGVEPYNGVRLWDLKMIDIFLSHVKDLTLDAQIVKYHYSQRFYELEIFKDGQPLEEILLEENFKLGNKSLIQRIKNVGTPPNCFKHPKFEFLETVSFYPTFDERFKLLQKGFDFNAFEERFVLPNVTDKNDLKNQIKSGFKSDENLPQSNYEAFKFLLKG